jgi:hypothetical protein
MAGALVRHGSLVGNEVYDIVTRAQRIRPATEYEYAHCYVIGAAQR